MIRTILRGAATALAVSCAASTATAQEVRLVFATTMAAGHRSIHELYAPWVKKVNELGKGVVAVEQRDGPNIATLANSYDRVMTDVVQIAWGLQPMLGGRFPLSEVAGLPSISDSCEKSAVALWRLYKSGLLESEYKDVVPLWLAVSAQNSIHFAKPPQSPLDLKGLKVNVFNRILVQVVERLGGTAVSFGAEQQYEALQRGNADAIMTAWSGYDAYKLPEVTSFHADVSLGSSAHMFFMARKKFDALPANARKVLLESASETQSRIHGKYWDELEQIARSKTASLSKHQIFKPTPSDVEALKRRVAPIIDDWAKSRPGGEKILAAYRGILAQVDAGK